MTLNIETNARADAVADGMGSAATTGGAADRQRAPGETAADGSAPANDERQALLDRVLAEFAAWAPRDRAPAFKLWHRGALSLIHLNVITVLESEGPLPMRRLAEALDVSDASATGIVDRMERRGFVERRHATDDRRLVLVHVTDRGQGIFREAERRRVQFFRAMLDELSADELATVLASTRILLAARQRLVDSGRMAELHRAAACSENDEHAAPPGSPASTQ